MSYPSQEAIKVVIADDHEIFRDGFKMILGKMKNCLLIGEASNGRELLEIVANTTPDLVITDIKMPAMDGIEATRKIREKWPSMGIIALSMFNEDDLIMEMLEAGANGYLIKNADKAEIMDAIVAVASGDPYYCRGTNNKLTKLIANSRFHPFHRKKIVEFSEKEIEIIRLICQEMTNKEIGENLFLSIRTVEGHRLRILDKMGVKNSVGLVIYAIQNNIFLPQIP
jgi:DNA-binding NarL/FixJ family response regulator